MGVGRSALLWASKNNFLKNHATQWKFIRGAVKKFMPGETVEKAIEAAKVLAAKSIPSTFTHLGENITNLEEAKLVVNHYLSVLEKIYNEKLDIEISLKLTQLGFDISYDDTLNNFRRIASKASGNGNSVWIDMEDSSYVDKTIKFYKEIKKEFNNVGLCLQSYLYRTEKDLSELIQIKPWIRLVKGAYKESSEIAFPDKKDVDTNYFNLSLKMLETLKENDVRMVFGTHDLDLINKVTEAGARLNIEMEKIEFHLLYGIKTNEQDRLSRSRSKIRVLISYGEYWYPWYVRRLAERPANVFFVLRNIFS